MLARAHTRQACLTCPVGSEAPKPLTILATVGRHAANRPQDVAALQAGLNRIPPSMGGPAGPLPVDGDCGGKTIAAIEAFQQMQLGWCGGVVTPAGVTWMTLAALAGALGPQATAAPDTASTTTRCSRCMRTRAARRARPDRGAPQ